MKRSLLLILSLVGALASQPLWAQTAPMNPYTLSGTTDEYELPSRTAISPDGKIAALAGSSEFGANYWVRLYDTTSRHLLCQITAHHAPVSTLLFAPDGKQLLTQDQEGGTLISEVLSGRKVKWLIAAKKGSDEGGMSEADSFLAWSKNGEQLLSSPYKIEAISQPQLKLWGVKNGMARVLTSPTTWRYEATFDRDGNVVTAEVDKKRVHVRRLDVSDGHQISQADLGEGVSIKVSPDGRFVLSTLTYSRSTAPWMAPEEQNSELWDVEAQRKLATLPGSSWMSHFSGDGKTLVTCDINGRIVLRDLAPGRYGAIRRELPPFAGGELVDVAISDDANWIFSLDFQPVVRLWNLHEELTPLRYPLRAMLQCSGRQQVRIINGGLRVTDVTGGSPTPRIEVQEMRAGALQRWQVPLKEKHEFLDLLEIAPTGKFLASYWRKENKIEIYDLDTKVLTSTWQAPEKLLGVSFSPDGSRLAVASSDGEITIRDVTGKVFLNWSAAGGSLEKVVWSPDGTLVTTLSDGFLTLWDARTGQEKKTLTEVNARQEFDWSPDSRAVAVGTGPKGDKFWVDQLLVVDREQGKIGRTFSLPKPQYDLDAVKFSPDGTMVGIVQGNSLRLFRIADGCEVSVPNDDCPVKGLFWVSASELALDTGGRLKIWDLKPERLAPTPKD